MIIEHYLRLEHCSNPGAGCPMAALSSEIARYPRAVRVEIDRAMQRRIKRLARFLPGKTGKERERNCLGSDVGNGGRLKRGSRGSRPGVAQGYSRRLEGVLYQSIFQESSPQKVTLVQN